MKAITFSNRIARNHRGSKSKIFIEKLDVRQSVVSAATFKILESIHNFRLPEMDEQLRIRTQTQLNLISMVLKIIEEHENIEELTIATYTYNTEAHEIILDLLRKKKIGVLNLFLASSYNFRNPEHYRNLKEICRQYENFHLTYAWLHLKITLAKCGENYYLFEGSMNYSTNNMAEQLLFENNQKSYEYDYNFLKNTLTDRNNKAIEVIG